ncbi:MAG TPA: nuclease A inhibitor family protein [Herpetosiphonaceae bacterium]
MTLSTMGRGGWFSPARLPARRALTACAAAVWLAACAPLALPWLFGGTELAAGAPAGWQAPALALHSDAAGCRPASARMTLSQTATKGGPVSKILQDLERLSEGLLFPNESDYPLEPFAWRSRKPFSAEALVGECDYPEGTAVETVEVDYFFRNVIQDQEWHTPEESEKVRRFRELLAYLKAELTEIQVYRVGAISIDAYILGKTADGHVVGLKTTLVET